MASLSVQQVVNPYTYEVVQQFSEFILARTAHRPRIGIVCGSGLGGLADTLEQAEHVDYCDIPNFPVSTVPGHVGRFVFGNLSGKPCVCMQGRFHMYEGYSAHAVTMPVRVMKLMGVEVLIVTNACGSINRKYSVGDVMIIKDHIFFPGFSANSPLLGPNDPRFGERFPAVSSAYDRGLRELAKQAAADPAVNLTQHLQEGVYANVGGPTFETVAEGHLLAIAGADVVGMSTAAEVIVAVHCGMRVFGLSLVTDECVMSHDDERLTSHDDVLETSRKRSTDLERFIRVMVGLVPEQQQRACQP